METQQQKETASADGGKSRSNGLLGGSIPLPNSLWIRSNKKPEYAICLDNNNAFFGWKMIENPAYKTWTSVARLTREEIVKAKSFPEFSKHLEQLDALLST